MAPRNLPSRRQLDFQPAYVGDTVTGQVQGKLDPQSIDSGESGPYFVNYAWATAGVFYSLDGTSGTFEPYGGNYAVGWKQDVPATQFSAQFFAPGQYLLAVQCVANVYSVYNGSLIASFTGTGYIGGDASDIDTGGGNAPHAQRARALRPNAAPGGGAGITVLPAVVTFSVTSIKLGLGSPHDTFKVITATVTPASQASAFIFSASNSEVTLEQNIDLISGTVTLTVSANSPTPGLPANSGTPDCYITAVNPSDLFSYYPVASVSVLVLVPSGIGDHDLDFNGAVTAENVVLGDKTSPMVPAGAGNLELCDHLEA